MRHKLPYRPPKWDKGRIGSSPVFRSNHPSPQHEAERNGEMHAELVSAPREMAKSLPSSSVPKRTGHGKGVVIRNSSKFHL